MHSSLLPPVHSVHVVSHESHVIETSFGKYPDSHDDSHLLSGHRKCVDAQLIQSYSVYAVHPFHLPGQSVHITESAY